MCPEKKPSKSIAAGSGQSVWQHFNEFCLQAEQAQTGSHVTGKANGDEKMIAADLVLLTSCFCRCDPARFAVEVGDGTYGGAADLGDVVNPAAYFYRGAPPPNCLTKTKRLPQVFSTTNRAIEKEVLSGSICGSKEIK
jgi:hypothetical protein